MSSRPLAALVAVLAIGLPAVAQAEAKLAYVDLQRALSEIGEGKALKSRLERTVKAKEAEFKKAEEQFRKDAELLQRQAAAMSDEVRNQRQVEMQQRAIQLQQQVQDARVEMSKQQQDELQAIFTKMNPIIAEIARREGFTMVFEKTDSGLIFADDSLDVTNELIRTYNTRNAGTKPKPKAKSTSARPKQ